MDWNAWAHLEEQLWWRRVKEKQLTHGGQHCLIGTSTQALPGIFVRAAKWQKDSYLLKAESTVTKVSKNRTEWASTDIPSLSS